VFRNMQGWQIVIIILAIIILIGWKRLPDAARSLGRSMRIFKSEVEKMGDSSDDDRPSAASTDTVDSSTPRRASSSGERSEHDRPGEDRSSDEAGHRPSDEYRS